MTTGNNTLRFGIHDGNQLRAATWKLWTYASGEKSDFYLAARLGIDFIHVSFHESGEWHMGYSDSAFRKYVGDHKGMDDRFIDHWYRPPEFKPRLTVALAIVTPWSAVTTEKLGRQVRGVRWVPNAPDGQATQITVLVLGRDAEMKGSQLIGAISLANGETVCVVHHDVEMPDLSGIARGSVRPFKGAGISGPLPDQMRALVFGDVNGTRCIYDMAVRHKQSTESRNG